jgi:hypothetical protein
MKTGDATALIVLAGGAVAVYFLYKTLNKTAQVACCVTQGILHPTCAVANSVTSVDNWLNCKLGFNTCGQ